MDDVTLPPKVMLPLFAPDTLTTGAASVWLNVLFQTIVAYPPTTLKTVLGVPPSLTAPALTVKLPPTPLRKTGSLFNVPVLLTLVKVPLTVPVVRPRAWFAALIV